MDPAALERPELRAAVAGGELGDAHDLPGVREVDVAAERLEDGDRAPCDHPDSVRVGRSAHVGEPGTLDRRPELGRLVVMPPRIVDRLDQHLVGGIERPGATERPAEVREQRRTLRRVDGKEPGRPVEKRRGRPTLVAIERAPSRAREHRTAFQRDRTGLVRDPPELRTRDVCLLEVVSDELLVARHLLVPRASSHDARPVWRSARSSFGIDE